MKTDTLTEKDPVKLAASGARNPRRDSRALVASLTAGQSGMLPIEADASGKVQREITKVLNETDVKGVLKRFPDAKLLDTSAFTMRRSDTGLPILAPFSLESADVSMGRGKEGFSFGFPNSLKSFYKDVDRTINGRRSEKIKMTTLVAFDLCALILWAVGWHQIGAGTGLWNWVWFSLGVIVPIVAAVILGWFLLQEDIMPEDELIGSARAHLLTPLSLPALGAMIVLGLLDDHSELFNAREISARFGGILPEEVRALSFRARNSALFDEVFILAEVPKWQIKDTGTPLLSRDGDPLLIGHEGGRFWLLAAFDVTPVEEYVAREYATNPTA